MRASSILLLVVIAPAALAAGARRPTALVGEPVVLEPHLSALRADLRPFRPLGGTLRIGEHEYAVRAAGSALTIARTPGGSPSVRVRGAETVKLRFPPGAGRKPLSVHLRPVAGGGDDVTWEYAVLGAVRFEIAGSEIDVVDANGDGRFRVGEDGYTTPGEPLLLPLRAALVIGRHRFAIEDLSEDGTHMKGTLEPLPGDRSQLDGLVELNRLRARGGLPPVVLDPELSAACSAHVEYLRKNGWSGYTNPHGEAEGRPGYSEAGVRAARAGAIVASSHVEGLRMHFLTYYHRIAFVNPRLERVGISAGSATISVIDGKSGAPEVEFDDEDGWDDPVLSPPDGATRVPTHFCRQGERPEPVSSPEGRGFPLLVLFPSHDPVIAGFEATLVELRKGKEIEVPTLAPESLGDPAYGAIPVRPLKGDALYRVTFSFERDGDPETVSATFRTE